MTNKQKLVAKDILENPGKPISRAMLDAGYDPNTAKNPSDLTESKGWAELMEKYLPDDKLLQKHEEALEAKKWNDFTGEREPDHMTRLKAVDLGYKLKRKIGGDNQTNIQVNVEKGNSITFVDFKEGKVE